MSPSGRAGKEARNGIHGHRLDDGPAMTIERRPVDETASISLKDHIDTQLASMNRAVDLALTAYRGEAVSLRDHITAILDEQRRGIIVAEQEREKAARALAITLAEQIRSGDQNLREHIGQQVQQIRAALEAAEKLEVARFDSLSRELNLITTAAAEAIAKAETATDKRLESMNELRGQLQDQATQFMSRDLAEAQFQEMRRALADLNAKLSSVVGS